MLCLGIESSCDETAIALVKDGRLIDEIIASQIPLHSLFGGVVPELAAREHYKIIGILFDKLLTRAAIDANEIDVIAVARGPGLLGSLLVGVAFAKALAFSMQKIFIGVNHLHAHMLAVGLHQEVEYPALGILVSGGHTTLYKIENPWTFKLLGQTLDDAAGEAFDKLGKELGLNYPAGKEIDRLSKLGNAEYIHLPDPFLDNNNLDFSFSGLKTAAIGKIQELKPINDDSCADFCASFNTQISKAIYTKAKRALERDVNFKSIWLAGGVAANSDLRATIKNLADEANLRLYLPPLKHCTDNAAMIAYAGFLLARNGFRHSLEMETIARGKKIPDDMLNERN